MTRAAHISVSHGAPPFPLLLGCFLHSDFYWPVDLLPLNKQDQIARPIYLRQCKSTHLGKQKLPVCALFKGKQRKVLSAPEFGSSQAGAASRLCKHRKPAHQNTDRQGSLDCQTPEFKSTLSGTMSPKPHYPLESLLLQLENKLKICLQCSPEIRV